MSILLSFPFFFLLVWTQDEDGWRLKLDDRRLTLIVNNSDPADRPTAETLLRAPFCFSDPHYNFLDTALYAKIRTAF